MRLVESRLSREERAAVEAAQAAEIGEGKDTAAPPAAFSMVLAAVVAPRVDLARLRLVSVVLARVSVTRPACPPNRG